MLDHILCVICMICIFFFKQKTAYEICRQRPGTAKGFVFISLEDETGVSNAIVDPDLFERFRLVITEEAFLLIEGQVQNSDSVVLIKARDIKPLVHERLGGSESHDFH